MEGTIITWLMWDNVTEIKLNIFGRVWLQNTEVSRCRPAVSNKTVLAANQKFFFAKVARIQSITDIALLDFWLMLFSGTFISSYTTIYFFVKKSIFSNFYISVYTILECLHMLFGWEKDHQLSTYSTGEG